MLEMLGTVVATVSMFGLGLMLMALAACILDVVHAGLVRVLMSAPATVFGWDMQDYSVAGTVWTCAVINFVINLGTHTALYLFGISPQSAEGPLSVVSISLICILTFAGGCAGTRSGSIFQRLVSGVTSVLAIPLAALLIGIVVATVC